MDFQAIWSTISDPKFALSTVAVFLFVKVGLAVIRAGRDKKLDIRILPDFLQSDVLPYGGGLSILWLGSVAKPELEPVFTASAAAVLAMLLAQIKDHALALFGKKE